MSDRENSPDAVGNSSERQSLEEKTPSAEGSPSPQEVEEERRTHSRSRSRSRSHSFRRRRSYSRSSRNNENPDEVENEHQRSHSRGGSHRYRHYSKSRSRSPRHRRYSRSRSRSRSYSPRRSYSPQYSPRHSYYDDRYYKYGGGKGGGGGGRYSSRYNRSPMSSRRRHVGNRDNPEPSRCLGVFGLSLYTQERELREVFGKYGPIEDVQVVYDAQSGRSRGFAFVYFEETDDAKMAKERCNGQEIDGRKIRVDFSITKRAHTPTPGIYMGKPTYPKFAGHRDGGGSYRGHSPSPYYSSKHRYSRSRSRSYSPRKYGYY
ncbi:transformer-2 protein homolog alpha-like isoform X2 [Uloborus diversus]|uniref:transformer-2 protein homolog alpha-like isoform X2 n=1 Tax=Uloborus diversus TaxID=327109 RepID=UPI00240A0DEB|nr:transformer-2 protein homolog alpha-like isoform X2 [Uloborus diversus]